MHYMRQNSGTGAGSGDTVTIGPCLDSAGAEYTGLVIGDLTITKNGTSAAMAANATLTHVSNGFYDLVMIGNNADTPGKLTIRCNKSTYQIPPAKYVVLTAAAYDTLVANGTLASTTSGRTIVVDAAGLADANTVKLGPSGSGTAQTARDVGGALPAAQPNTANGVITFGTGTGQLSPTSGGVDLRTWLGVAPLALTSQRVEVLVGAHSSGALTALRTYLLGQDTAALQTDASGYVKGSAGTGTGQWNLSSGRIAADVTHLLGTAWLTPVVAGTPDVNAKQAGGVAWGSGAITAASIAAAALNGKGDWNIGKTGYTLTQAFPTNFAALGINASGHISRTTLTDTLTTYTGNTPQTGDVYPLASSSGVVVGSNTAAALTALRTYLHGTDVAAQMDASGYHKLSNGTGTGQISLTSGLVKISGTKQTLDDLNDVSAAGVWDLANGIETGFTPRQVMRGFAALWMGLVNDANTPTETFHAMGALISGTTRVTSTVDSSGNRSGMVFNL
jgi:hypothetical protein